MAKLWRADELLGPWFRRRRRAAATLGPVVVPSAFASLGGLTATANANPNDITGSAVAQLGGLTATATGTRTTSGTAVADLGGLVATAAGTRTTALGGSSASLTPTIYLVDRDTGELTPLGQWATLQVSPLADAVGSVQVGYPVGGDGFATLHSNVGKHPTVDGTVDQEVEVRLTGSTAGRSRWLLQQKEGDDLDRGSLWTFTGVSLEQLLAEVLLGPQATPTQELTFDGVTPGAVLATVFDAVQGRDVDCLPGMARDFTATVDSNGDPWAHTLADLKFGPTDTVLSTAQALVDLVVVEFEVTWDRVLRAYNPGGRGHDYTTGAAPLRFQQGTNLAKADRRESARVGDAATAVLAKGSDGVYQWVTDATAQAARGRRVEVAHDAGQLTSTGAVAAAGQARLDGITSGVSERSHGIVFAPGAPIPGVDFDTGDWAYSFAGSTAERLRIVQWTARFERELGSADGTVVMNDVVTDRLVALQRALAAQSRGGAVVGTSTSPAATDDGIPPAPPTGVTASSSAYLDADGATQAAVEATWTPPPDDDVVGYLVELRYTADGPTAGWIPVGQVTGTSIDFDRVIADRAIAVRVSALDRWGHVSTPSLAFELTSGADATPPPVPSASPADGWLGLLRIPWDGLGSLGEPMPPDYDRTEIYASQAEVYAVGDPGALFVGQLRTAGTYAWSPPNTGGGVDYDVPWFVRMRTVDRSGNASALSAAAAATPGKAGEGDIESVNIGSLTAGILQAIMTVSGLIQTAPPGSSRVAIDSDGLRCYVDDDLVFEFDASAALLQMVGRITVGEQLGAGDRIELTQATGYPTMFFYDALSGTNRAYINAVRSSSNRMGLGLNSGADASGATANQSTLFLLPQEISLQVNTFTPTPNLRRGGYFYANRTSAQIGLAPSGSTIASLLMNTDGGGYIAMLGPNNNNVSLYDDGTTQVVAGAGNYLIGGPGFMQLVSGGSVKSFVIPHPDDDPADPQRWLVHACTESPTAGVEYTGTAVIADHLAVVELPPYFEALTEPDGRTVFLQPELTTWRDPISGNVRPMVAQAAPSAITDGRFHIVCPAEDGTRVHWQVKATRRGAAFDVEPRRADVEVHGDGPYRYIP